MKTGPINKIPMVTLSKLPMRKIQKENINFSSPNEWDICYKYNYPFNVLCNFSPSSFFIDGVDVNSMEGFLQSLKIPDKETQKKVCQLPGFLAKKLGNYVKRTKQFDGEHLYWNGKKYNRYKGDYLELLKKAYLAKYFNDADFRRTLSLSNGYRLTHKIGKTSPQETILTEEEFINNLDALRKNKNVDEVIRGTALYIQSLMKEANSAPIVAKRLSKLKTTFVNSHLLCGENVFLNQNVSLAEIKRAKVKNIIQLNVPQEEAIANRRACKKAGLNYFSINIPSRDSKASLISNRKLLGLIDVLNNKGLSYICCNERQDCNPVLMLNYLFNPKANLADALVFGTPKKKDIFLLYSTVMKNITPETKNRLGWGDELEKSLKIRSKILSEING